MTIQFRCQGCGGEFQVPDSMAGVVSHCNRCGAVIAVPHAAAGAPAPGFAAVPTRTPYAPVYSPAPGHAPRPVAKPVAHSRAQNSTTWSPAVLVALGGGATTVVVVLLMILTHSGKGPRESKPTAESRSAPVDDLLTRLTSGSGIEVAPPPSSPVAGSDPFANPGRDDAGAPASTKVAASPKRAASGGQLKISAGAPNRCELGPLGCPVVVAGDSVWRLSDNREIAKLGDGYVSDQRSALSEDGHWLAQGSNSTDLFGGESDRDIRVWDARSGKLTQTVPNPDRRKIKMLKFVRNDYLLVGVTSPGELQVFHVPSGRAFPAISIPEQALPNKISISRDGRRVAYAEGQRIVKIRTATGDVEFEIGSPSDALASPKGNNAGDLREAISKLVGFELSPDGSELAMLTEHPRLRLLCWDARGEKVFDETLDETTNGTTEGGGFRWLPDGSGWLCGCNVYDRRSKRCVFQLQRSVLKHGRYRFADNDRLIGFMPNVENRATDVPIPWESIRKSLRALEEGVPAYVRRGKSVGAKVELKNVRRDPQDSKRMLLEGLSRRLARNGITIADGSPATIHLRLVEEPPEEISRSLPGRPKSFNPPARQTFKAVYGTVYAELWVPGKFSPIWSEDWRAVCSFEFLDTMDDDTIERKFIRDAVDRIENLNLPYFVPESSDLVALPVYRSSPR